MSGKPGPALPDSAMSGKIADYRLDTLIGQGGMAAVYLARDERINRKVALKVLAPELARDAAFRTRFLRESQAAAAVDHPNIIPVYEAGDASGTLYVAMRYVQGGDVRSLLNRLGPLPFGRAWDIIAQVASALDAAHARGLIHRDVKPASMLLDVSGGAGRRMLRRAASSDFDHVYLSDFGISKNSLPGEITASSQFAGSLDYLAPEQVDGRPLDGRADLYSLASAGFELLCGTPPFGQEEGLTVLYAQLYAPPPSATARRADLPAAADLVLATALAKNPADRYGTCGQFAAELHSALGLLPGEPDGPARPRPHGRGGQVTQAALVPGGQESATQLDFEHEPTRAWAPVQAGPGQPQAPAAGQAPVGQAPGGQAAAGQAAAGQVPAGQVPAGQVPAGQVPAGPGRGTADSVGGPGGPRPGRPGVIRLILAVAAVAVVAAVVVTGVVLSGRPAPGKPAGSAPAGSAPAGSAAPSSSPPASPAPSASTLASRQAAAVSSLLGSSAATRQSLQGAVNDVRNCANLPGAVSQIQGVVNQRGTEYSQASGLSTANLADGAALKSDLNAALRNSLDADRDYLTWAQQQLDSGCTPTAQSSAYNAAYNAGQQAGAAKEAFVQVWNPVAARYGLQQKSPGSI